MKINFPSIANKEDATIFYSRLLRPINSNKGASQLLHSLTVMCCETSSIILTDTLNICSIQDWNSLVIILSIPIELRFTSICKFSQDTKSNLLSRCATSSLASLLAALVHSLAWILTRQSSRGCNLFLAQQNAGWRGVPPAFRCQRGGCC